MPLHRRPSPRLALYVGAAALSFAALGCVNPMETPKKVEVGEDDPIEADTPERGGWELVAKAQLDLETDRVDLPSSVSGDFRRVQLRTRHGGVRVLHVEVVLDGEEAVERALREDVSDGRSSTIAFPVPAGIERVTVRYRGLSTAAPELRVYGKR